MEEIIIISETRELLVAMVESLNSSSKYYPDDEYWISNCIDCLSTILEDTSILSSEGFPVRDLLNTIDLIYKWLIDGSYSAYIEIRQKFKPVYSAETAGRAFKTLIDRMNQR